MYTPDSIEHPEKRRTKKSTPVHPRLSKKSRRPAQKTLIEAISRYNQVNPQNPFDGQEVSRYFESKLDIRADHVWIQQVADYYDLLDNCNTDPFYSRMSHILFYAAANGWLEFRKEKLAALGYPDLEALLATKFTNAPAKTFTKRLYTILQTQSISAENINSDIIRKFENCKAIHRENFALGRNHFVKAWNQYAKLNNLPELRSFAFPIVPYAAKLDELPEPLKSDVKNAFAALQPKQNVDPLLQPQPLGEDQINLTRSITLQLLGFLKEKDTTILEGRTLQDIITRPNAVDFIRFCKQNAQQREARRLGCDASTMDTTKEQMFGYTELTVVWQLRVLAKRGLNDPELAKDLWGLRQQIWKIIKGAPESRLARHKPVPEVNTLFEISHQLLILSDGPSKQGFGRVHRALLRRDALIFCLLGHYTYRRKTISKITLKDIQTEPTGETYLRVPKRNTKSKMRDHWHVVPLRILNLFNQYLNVERPILLGRQDSDSFFIGRNGAPLTPTALSDMFKQRFQETMNVDLNIHQCRTIWYSQFIDWSDGDYLTASVIMDASVRTCEIYYRERRDGLRITSKFDTVFSDFAQKAATSYKENL